MMHADELDIDADLVRRLLAVQFPQWAALPLARFPSAGTVNAMFRLGSALGVRLPLIAGGVGDVELEQRWLSHLAPHLPVAIPSVLGKGVPGDGYPWPWTVFRWLEGDNPVVGALAEPRLLAKGLASFVAAMRQIDSTDGPPASRGKPLSTRDTGTRAAIQELAAMIGTDGLRGTSMDGLSHAHLQSAAAAWARDMSAPVWRGRPVWVHGDLMPGNLLVEQGRLSAVIDFGTMGTGDPACDLISAWNLLPAEARPAFRAALDVDDATWARGRALALSMALIQLPYYVHTNPSMAANARHVIGEVLDE